MRGASAQELADLLRRGKEILLQEWEAEVRKLPRESNLTSPVLRDHVPALIDEMIRDIEDLACSEHAAKVSRIHGEQRQTTGLDVGHVVEEYKLLRMCMTEHVERTGLSVAGHAGRLLNEIIDDGIRAAISAYLAQRDKDERARRDEYLQFIVHDLRSPLTAISHAMLLLERRLTKIWPEELDLSIPQMVKRNIGYMQALTVKLLQEEQNIRLVTKIEVRYSSLRLAAVVEKAITTLSPLAESAKTKVVNEIASDILAHGDPDLLQRVFQNLISNAIDYTPKGTVTIGAALTGDGSLECWVIDDGRGIPDDVKPEVFEKYRTTRRRGGGTGLGLTVVKQIIEAHGGTIELQSEVDFGTTVRFRIPLESAKRLQQPLTQS
jgi:two-component system phosphate regulon sensor histidine kinase PhoR